MSEEEPKRNLTSLEKARAVRAAKLKAAKEAASTESPAVETPAPEEKPVILKAEEALPSLAKSKPVEKPVRKSKAGPPVNKSVCPFCFGREVVELEETHHGIPITAPCKCAIVRDIVRNLERGWVGIARAAPLKSPSPLLEYVTDDLYLTSSDPVLKSHLKFVGAKLGRNWSFAVVTDADLMSSWLANAKLSGKEIFDPDVIAGLEKLGSDEGRRIRTTLEDLVEPPGLLIIRIGVKNARNSATHEVFLEALKLRDHLNRPTWVVDQPEYRLHAEGHLCYSPEVEEKLGAFPYLALSSTNLTVRELASTAEDAEESETPSTEEGSEPTLRERATSEETVKNPFSLTMSAAMGNSMGRAHATTRPDKSGDGEPKRGTKRR
jgi:hypothetical protein